MINNGSAGTPDEKSPWVQPGFIAAAAVVALLVLLGLVLAVTGGSEGQARAGGTGRARRQRPATGDPDASVCGLPPGSQRSHQESAEH